MWDWECGESGGLQLEPHVREGRGLLSDPERDQCQVVGGGLVM